jgi:hypothetical protein
MNQKEKYLENADNCIALAEKAKDAPSKVRYKRMAEAWLALAEEQDWLAGEISPMPGMSNSPKFH